MSHRSPLSVGRARSSALAVRFDFRSSPCLGNNWIMAYTHAVRRLLIQTAHSCTCHTTLCIYSLSRVNRTESTTRYGNLSVTNYEGVILKIPEELNGTLLNIWNVFLNFLATFVCWYNGKNVWMVWNRYDLKWSEQMYDYLWPVTGDLQHPKVIWCLLAFPNGSVGSICSLYVYRKACVLLLFSYTTS